MKIQSFLYEMWDKYKGILLFTFIHLIGLLLTILLFCNIVINIDLYDSIPYIFDLIIVIITIIISFQFIIKQIYINRLSGKYISPSFSKKTWYKTVMLIVTCIVFAFKFFGNYANEIIVSTIFTSVYFLIDLLIDIKRIELETYIKGRIKKIIRLINNNISDDRNLSALYQLYQDCTEKNEINLAIQIIKSYESFFVEKLCKKNENLVKQKISVEEIEKLQERIIMYLGRMITNDNSVSYKRLDTTIYRSLSSCLRHCYKCNDINMQEYIQHTLIKFCSEKGENFDNDTYWGFVRNMLDEDNNCKEQYTDKLRFLLTLYNNVIDNKNFNDKYCLFDFLIYEI